MPQELIEGEGLLLRDSVGVGDRLYSESQEEDGGHSQEQDGSLHIAPSEDADEEDNDPRTRQRRKNHKRQIGRGDLEVEAEWNLMDLPVGDHHGRAEKDQRPARDRERFQKLPSVDIAMGQRQRKKPGGFAAFEERGIADDQVRKNQHHEKESEDKVEDSLREQVAHQWKAVQKLQAGVKQPVADSQIAEDEQRQHPQEERRLPADAAQARDQGAPMHPQQKPK
jgi:hypothetical protein